MILFMRNTHQQSDVKICITCQLTKELIDFPLRRNKCKSCYNAYQKEYRQRPEVRKKVQASWRGASKRYYSNLSEYKRYVRKYALSEEEYVNLLNKQNAVCAICKKDRKLVIDHDHSTGQVRGLLCTSCNLILGHAKDDIRVLEAAIQYIAE